MARFARGLTFNDEGELDARGPGGEGGELHGVPLACAFAAFVGGGGHGAEFGEADGLDFGRGGVDVGHVGGREGDL